MIQNTAAQAMRAKPPTKNNNGDQQYVAGINTRAPLEHKPHVKYEPGTAHLAMSKQHLGQKGYRGPPGTNPQNMPGMWQTQGGNETRTCDTKGGDGTYSCLSYEIHNVSLSLFKVAQPWFWYK